MVRAPAVRVPRAEAEATRRRLLELDALRLDLAVAKDGDHVVFPVVEACGPRLPTIEWEFAGRELRPTGYQDLLDLPEALKAAAPRAFDQVGDVVVVKVPPELWPHRGAVGEALLRFLRTRAVFHDRGVKDPHRVRDLELLAGEGGALTQVHENGVALWVDLSRAYYSPRLATERARVADLVQPGEHVVDLFGGVAPFGIQCALRGARVDSVDINPDAAELARRNVEANRVGDRVAIHLGDARDVAPRLGTADRVVMNLPHAARGFLDVAARLAGPGATVHHHEIVPDARIEDRERELVGELAAHSRGVTSVSARVVRNYSPTDSHVAFDLRLA